MQTPLILLITVRRMKEALAASEDNFRLSSENHTRVSRHEGKIIWGWMSYARQCCAPNLDFQA